MNTLWIILFILGCVLYTIGKFLEWVAHWILDNYLTLPYKVGHWYETIDPDRNPFEEPERRKILRIEDGWVQYRYEGILDPEYYCTRKSTRYLKKHIREIENPELEEEES